MLGVLENEGTAIYERKTTKAALSGGYFAQWKPHNQTTAYALAGSALFSEDHLAGASPKVMIEACQTLVNGTRFYTSAVEYSKAQMEEFLQDTLYWIAKAEEYADMGYWPMNRTSCDNKGGCPFRDVCSRDPSTREVVLKDQFSKLPSVYENEAFRRFLEAIIIPKESTNANNLPSQPIGPGIQGSASGPIGLG